MPFHLACKQYFMNINTETSLPLVNPFLLTDSGNTGSTRAAMDQSAHIYPKSLVGICLVARKNPPPPPPEIIPKERTKSEKVGAIWIYIATFKDKNLNMETTKAINKQYDPGLY
jgi:hypothetical protein